MKTRTEIKMTEGEREAVETLAEYLNWGLSETIRRALKFGLQSLLKFETGNKKADLRALIEKRKSSKDQQDNKNIDQENQIKKAKEKIQNGEYINYPENYDDLTKEEQEEWDKIVNSNENWKNYKTK